MNLPLIIGENSAHVPFPIDLQTLPHLFLSYCEESQAQTLYAQIIEGLSSGGNHSSIQFALAFTRIRPSFDTRNGALFPACFIQHDDYSSTVPSKDVFWKIISRELQRRWKASAKAQCLNEDSRPLFPPMVILLDDVLEMVVSPKKSVGVTFLHLLLMGHLLHMHVVAASYVTCRNLLRQLMQINPVVRAKFHKLFHQYPMHLTTTLGAELVFTAEDFIFFKEANQVEYTCLYPLRTSRVPQKESCLV